MIRTKKGGSMNTKCFTKKIRFQDLGQRKLEADFSAGYITSDAGGLILKEIEARRGLIFKSFLIFLLITVIQVM